MSSAPAASTTTTTAPVTTSTTTTGTLFIREEQKAALTLLLQLDDSAKQEFVVQAANSLTAGINRKIVSLAAKRLGRSVTDVELCIVAIMKLFTDSARLKLSPDVADAAIAEQLLFDSSTDWWHESGCSAQFCSILSERAAAIRDLVSAGPDRMQFNSYDDMEWRLEATMASRFLRRTNPSTDPAPKIKVSMALQLKSDKGELGGHMLEIDVPTLTHITASLEQALQHGKDRHLRRLAKNL